MRPEPFFENEYQKFKELFQQPWIQIFILITFCFLLFILGVGRWDLWDPDEPRYAEVSKEMVDTGNWILMHLNGKMYTDKPPLFFWFVGLSSHLFNGFTSFSVRFPAAFFGTLTVLLTFLLGRNLYSTRTGFFSGFVLATSFEFVYLSTRANIDTTLTFFTTASLLCFIRWQQENNKGSSKGLPIYGFYIGMALATLAKGPIGFILPLLVSLAFLVIQKDWKRIKAMRLIPGMLLFLLIVLAWYLSAVLKGGGKDYLNATLLHHSFERFAKGSSHVRPIYYYLVNFPVDFLPWTLFLPGVISIALSKRREGIEKGFLFLLVWFVSIFLFFSFSKGKREIYLLPLYPAASLMVGNLWDNYISNPNRDPKREIWVSLPVYVLAAFFFFMGIILYLIPLVAGFPINPNTPRLLGAILKGARLGIKYLSYVPYRSFVPFIILLLGSGILLALSQRLKHKLMVFLLIVIIVGIGFFYGTRFIFPLLDPYKSARFLSLEIQLNLPLIFL